MRIAEKKKILNKEMIVVILSLAWPTMLEQLMQTTVQYIDTAMVGTLGTQATAAVGSTGTINWLVNGSIGALSIGFLSYIAKACGAKDLKNAISGFPREKNTTTPCRPSRTALKSSLSVSARRLSFSACFAPLECGYSASPMQA